MLPDAEGVKGMEEGVIPICIGEGLAEIEGVILGVAEADMLGVAVTDDEGSTLGTTEGEIDTDGVILGEGVADRPNWITKRVD